MIFRIVGLFADGVSVSAGRATVMRLPVYGVLVCGLVVPGVVLDAVGSNIGPSTSSSAVITTGGTNPLLDAGAPCRYSSALRARNSAVGAVVMLLVWAISRGGLPPPGLATNRLVPPESAEF